CMGKKELITMKKSKVATAAASVAMLSLALMGCGSGGSSSNATTGLALTVEDYYTWSTGQVMDSIYQSCAAAQGDTIVSTHVDGAGLIAKVLQQGSSKTLPDVLMLDNPDVQQIA